MNEEKCYRITLQPKINKNIVATVETTYMHSSVVVNLELREFWKVIFPAPSPSPPLPFHSSLPFEVGPLNPAKGLGK